jgi:NAD(P)-dependent dehydrogenase (short-subunit alcohol dehydrogenase family)
LLWKISNKVVIIRGIQNLPSVAAYRAGAGLLVERGEDSVKKVFADLSGLPDYLLMGGVDLTDPNLADQMAAKVNGHFGRIDVLINTVGGYHAGTPLHETPVQTLDFMYNLNVRTLFLACRAVIPYMLVNGFGKIVSVAARPGLAGRADMAAYSAAKSAVIRLTESMAAELKHSRINVNCIIPGTIDTPQKRQEMPDADASLWVHPDSLADVVLFLTSYSARDVHGAAVPVLGLS